MNFSIIMLSRIGGVIPRSAYALALFLACAALSSCGTWVNPSNPNANYQADYYSCQMQAASVYPVVMQTATTPSVTNTNCTAYGNQATCTSTTNQGQQYNSGGDVNDLAPEYRIPCQVV